jgi:carboxymethylenebutenolidase
MKLLLVVSPLLWLAGCAPGTPVSSPGTAGQIVVYRSDPVEAPAWPDRVCGFLCYPTETRPHPALILVHADFGLTDWVKKQASRLAQRGYVVLAVDLYRGRFVTDPMNAHILDRGLLENQVTGDLKAAVDYLAGQADVRGDAIGIIGWESGGGYALDAALRDPRLRAAVVCYGRLTTDPALLTPLRASVLGIFAGKDEGISSATIEEFRTAMQRAGTRLAGIHVYPDCTHGFMDPSSPHRSGPPATEAIADAWSRIESFLKSELNP